MPNCEEYFIPVPTPYIPINKEKFKIWRELVNYDNEMEDLYNTRIKENYQRKFAVTKLSSEYLEQKVFPYLIPAFERCCALAIAKNAIKDHKIVFNGLDSISEYLWNTNPKHPKRRQNWIKAYFIYKDKSFTRQRPVYPLSWVLTKQEATLKIQKAWLGYRVRQRYDIKELLLFWKIIEFEKWVLVIPNDEEKICPPKPPLNEIMF